MPKDGPQVSQVINNPPKKLSYTPKTQDGQNKCFTLFTEYCRGKLTQKQLANKHGLSLEHVNKSLKWAAHKLNKNMTSEVHKEFLVRELHELREELKKSLAGKRKGKLNPQNVYDLVQLIKELRLTAGAEARLRGVIDNAQIKIDQSDNRKVIVTTKVKRSRNTRNNRVIETKPTVKDIKAEIENDN